jgi:2-polyprenyl-3-methyl-5-hydroxy-6-metoxy-1,4-benzoquinol methylase
LFGAAMGMADLLSVYIGDRLGLYSATQSLGACTSQDLANLASEAGIHERYAREWLAQQASTGFLEVVEQSDDDTRRRYALPQAYIPVFLEKDDLVHSIPLAHTMVSAVRPIDAILEAFRTGGGVGWADYGLDGREGQEGFNRAAFANLLGPEWFPAIPELDARLREGARLLDVACGTALSSIAIAKAYPNATVDAVDIDPASVDRARENVARAGLLSRIDVRLADGAGISGHYDVATVFEAVHDLSDPVSVLRAVHQALKPGGLLVVVDEKVGEHFTAPAENPVESFLYGASLLICLPAGMAQQPSAGTGTVMRPSTLAAYARQAGFAGIESLDVEYPMFNFYLLRK